MKYRLKNDSSFFLIEALANSEAALDALKETIELFRK